MDSGGTDRQIGLDGVEGGGSLDGQAVQYGGLVMGWWWSNGAEYGETTMEVKVKSTGVG